MRKVLCSVVISFFVTGMVFAADHPCQTIKAACEKAGFIKGDAKEGNGLWVDCIDPIMKGKPQPPKAKIALPQVDASVVSACKAKNPNFGEGKANKPAK